MKMSHLLKVIFIYLLLIIPSGLSAQWLIKYIPADGFNAMSVIGTDTVIAATNGSGRIHRSFDGGATWSSYQTIFANSWFNDMHFPSKTVGYACGGTAFGWYTNVIAKTIDGGNTWDSLTSNAFSGYNFTNIDFENDFIGLVSGESGLLLRTEDAGATFINLVLPNGGTVTEIYWANIYSCFVGTYTLIGTNTYRYEILESVDLGDTWSTVYADSMAMVNGLNHRTIENIQFIDAMNGFAVGGNGLFLKTTDAGKTWNQSFISPFNHLTSVHFTDVNTGYINNAGGIYRTDDGGITWTAQNMNQLSVIYQIAFANSSIGYAIGSAGVYKTTNGGVLTGIENNENMASLTVIPNPASEFIQINANELEIEKVLIRDITGKLKIESISDFHQLDVSTLSKGVYIVSVFTKKNNFVLKLIKE